MAFVRIALLCTASAVVYGIVQDQVTARVCVEYFTVGHPPVFEASSPTVLALGWGIIATWWVGLLLSVPLGLAARAGHRPPLDARDLVKPILLLLAVISFIALASGFVGFGLARAGAIRLLDPLASKVPREKHVLFLADLGAHMGAYAGGFLGGIVLCILIWRKRGRVGGPR